MQKHRFSLQPYKGPSTRFPCPECGEPKQFSRYIDMETNEYLGQHVGKCNRLDKCGYHFTPKDFFKTAVSYIKQKNTITLFKSSKIKNKKMEEKSIDYIPVDLINKALNEFRQTNFGRYVITRCGEESTLQLDDYLIGRSSIDNKTACIFLQRDIKGKFRTGKIMAYDPITGKRKRDEIFTPKWIHNEMPKPFNYQQCFFGEHLLAKYKTKTIGIVESEKTAVIAAIFIPEIVWLATGGISGVKWTDPDVNTVLKDRKVILFPDFGYYNKPKRVTCFEYWSACAETIRNHIKCDISISKVLEEQLNESVRDRGFDIADFLIA